MTPELACVIRKKAPSIQAHNPEASSLHEYNVTLEPQEQDERFDNDEDALLPVAYKGYGSRLNPFRLNDPHTKSPHRSVVDMWIVFHGLVRFLPEALHVEAGGFLFTLTSTGVVAANGVETRIAPKYPLR